MNKKLIDYKREYSKIEIDVIPEDNKYGKFINISKKYYKIYFNDKKEEIKRKKIKKIEKINKIKVIINYKIKSLSNLFNGCNCIKTINFIKFNREDITNMSGIFLGCSSLKELNLTNFNTSNVTDMNNMFYGCSSLKELNLSNFNTNNLTNMCCMFYECSSLIELISPNELIKEQFEFR